MNEFDAIKIQLALFAIAKHCCEAQIAVSVSGETYKEIQESPVYLPEVLGTNEQGKRPMTKAELETFIDQRWRSHFERLEKEVETLKRRLNELESKGK